MGAISVEDEARKRGDRLFEISPKKILYCVLNPSFPQSSRFPSRKFGVEEESMYYTLPQKNKVFYFLNIKRCILQASLSGRAEALLLLSPLRTGLTSFPSIRLKQVSIAMLSQDGFVDDNKDALIGS